MRRLLLRIAPVLRLTRVTMAFAAVANVWFVILWTRAVGEAEPGTEAIRTLPLWALLLGASVNALGLFAYGAALNDILDVGRDRTIHPMRPLASGSIKVERAVVLALVTLMTALVGATALGIEAVLLTLVVASAILFFHAMGKFVPAVGLVALGLIYAGQMVVPNLYLHFVWPVWLVMTHALLVGAASHVIGRKVPPISRRAFGAAVLGWVFWSGVMLYSSWVRLGRTSIWPDWVPIGVLVVPLVFTALFAVLAWRRVRVHGRGGRAAEKVSRYGALWPALYACAWLFGMGFFSEGVILMGLAVAGFIGMTVLREVYSMMEQPLTYRV